MSKKYVYLFSEGDASMRNLLGGKGANLAEMTKLGLPVPQGFTISTEACTKYYEDGKTIDSLSLPRFMRQLPRQRKLQGKNLAIRKILSWFPCVRALGLPCLE